MSESKQEFLTFIIGTEEYAVEILRVQEIRGWQVPNPLPNVPDFVKGVVNLRGTVVPIIDLRQKFNLPTSYDGTTVVIVVHVLTERGEKVVGLVVDAVSDVHVFDMNNLQAPPDISTSLKDQFVLGLTSISEDDGLKNANNPGVEISEGRKAKSRMVIIIDIDKLAAEGLVESIVGNDDSMPTGNG
ncbi:MAG: purine-binding chemotaxis protein CheW [Gammaproteobacteria bacterium]|nr:purine-binding chemotaxis protein CheW [Gammaproteobacteria bacterium]